LEQKISDLKGSDVESDRKLGEELARILPSAA